MRRYAVVTVATGAMLLLMSGCAGPARDVAAPGVVPTSSPGEGGIVVTTSSDGSETITTTYPDGTEKVEVVHSDGHHTAAMPSSDGHPNQEELVARYRALREHMLSDWTAETGSEPVPAPTLTAGANPLPTPATTALPTPTATVSPTGSVSPQPSPSPSVMSPSPSVSAPGSSSYSFLAEDADGPVTWTSCRALTYRVNTDQMPTGAMREVEAALAEAGAAAGLSFTYAGTTSFVPWASSNPTTFEVADIVIAWADATSAPDLAGSVIGRGGVSWAPRTTPSAGAQMQMTAGMVLLDTAFVPTSMSGPGASLRGLLLHEIGHALNLGHVSDATQVMNPTLSAVSPETYGNGDKRGLSQVADRFDCS